jgi:hypothetical protein
MRLLGLDDSVIALVAKNGVTDSVVRGDHFVAGLCMDNITI